MYNPSKGNFPAVHFDVFDSFDNLGRCLYSFVLVNIDLFYQGTIVFWDSWGDGDDKKDYKDSYDSRPAYSQHKDYCNSNHSDWEIKSIEKEAEFNFEYS